MTLHVPSTPTAPVWLVIVTVVAVAADAYFRLTNLDTKVYWHDETWTSVALSHHLDQALAARLRPLAPLKKLQRIER